MELSRKFRQDDSRRGLGLFQLFLILNFVMVVMGVSTVVVDSPFGKIQGLEVTDEDTSQSYASFQGIPYARPPLGDLRFAKPQPHPKMVNTFDASKDDTIICPHPDAMGGGGTGYREDCLVLNVYVKEINRAYSAKKVLVFIHGGSFRAGFGKLHNPKSFVMSQDIIVVTINYRIGILGFLSMENDESPGNYGLWDQTLAIQWVKDNIQAFGGDPNDIAISGESAGAMSVGYQAISPHTKGLFSKAYVQSGTATSSFALSSNALADALSIAKPMGCWTKSINDAIGDQERIEVINCLRNVSISTMTAFYGYSLTDVQFVPRVDGDFLPDIPSKLMRDDEYLDSIGFFERAYLTGLNNNEAQISYSYIELFSMVASLAPGLTQEEKEEAVQGYQSKTEHEHIKSRLGETAASNNNISHAIQTFYKRRFVNERSFIEIMTDVIFVIPTLDLVRTTSRRENCNSYLFYFDYYPHFMKGAYTGMPHAADLLFWFDISISVMESTTNAGMQGEMEKEDMDMKRLFSSIIGEFVRSGNPGLSLTSRISCGWPRYDASNGHFLNLNTNPWVGRFLVKDKQDFWFNSVPDMTGISGDTTGTNLISQCNTNGAPRPLAVCSDCYLVFLAIILYFRLSL